MTRKPRNAIDPTTGHRTVWTRLKNGDVKGELFDASGHKVSQGVMSPQEAHRMAAGDRKDGFVVMKQEPAAPPDPCVIPEEVRRASSEFDRRLEREFKRTSAKPWWRKPVPDRGIPVVFAERGIYKPGTPGWIIGGHERTVFLGAATAKAEDLVETKVAEFVVVIPNGSQALAQVGRDIRFALPEQAVPASAADLIPESISQDAEGTEGAIRPGI